PPLGRESTWTRGTGSLRALRVVVAREGARGKPVRVRRGPATVTGSGEAGREAGHWGIPGKAPRRCERKPGDLPPPEHRHRFRGMEQLVHRRSGRLVGPRVLPAVLAVLAALALLVGCERRQQDAPSAGAPAATVVATADYGVRDLL